MLLSGLTNGTSGKGKPMLDVRKEIEQVVGSCCKQEKLIVDKPIDGHCNCHLVFLDRTGFTADVRKLIEKMNEDQPGVKIVFVTTSLADVHVLEANAKEANRHIRTLWFEGHLAIDSKSFYALTRCSMRDITFLKALGQIGKRVSHPLDFPEPEEWLDGDEARSKYKPRTDTYSNTLE